MTIDDLKPWERDDLIRNVALDTGLRSDDPRCERAVLAVLRKLTDAGYALEKR